MSVYYPQGAYLGEVIEHGLSETKTGKPQAFFKFKVLEPTDSTLGQLESYERTAYWVMTDKTMEFVLEKLGRLGFVGRSFADIGNGAWSCVGQQHEWYCKHDSYEGNKNEKWDLSRGAGEVRPVDSDAVRKLDALFGKQLKEVSKASQAKAATPEKLSKDAASAGGDDVPF